MIAYGSEVIPVQECMHRLRSYDLSASYADPKPWMEFSETTGNKVDSGCNRKCRTMVADNLSVTLSASYALTVHGSPFSANLSCVSPCARPFLIDSLDFALAEERFFGALRAFFAREAFFFVTAPPVPAAALDGAADLPRALQSTFFCDCRLAGSGIPAKRLRSRYLISFGS